MLVDEGSELLPNNDDEATVEAEVNKDIQQDANMDRMGESPQLKKDASDWEKKTVAAIAAMSKTQGKATAENDQLSKKFAQDIHQAEKVVKGPKVKKVQELKIDQEADAALANPNAAKELKAQAEQAERDMATSFIPVSLIQEPDDLGEDDLSANVKLTSGSESKIMKAINDQIGEQVSAKLGQLPNTVEPELMQRFEQDKEDASKFLMQSKHKSKAAEAKEEARKKVEAELKSASVSLGEAKNAEDNKD